MNKGFTLVELLGVVVIFALLIVVITIAADDTLKKAKKKLSNVQIEYIEESAQAYYLREGINNSYNNNSFKLCVNLDYLIENDYIENEELFDPKDYEKLTGSVEITYKSDQFDYKYRENSCTYEYKGIDGICTAVDDDTVTTGNVPKGMYKPGDEYICEVKDNTKYHFFVLSTEGENVNFIMERNIYYDKENDIGKVATSSNRGVVGWYANSNDHSYGPVDAMAYLHSSTKDWNNIPNIIINYEDENINKETGKRGTTGYGSIITIDNSTKITEKAGYETGRIQNLKTRMPRYNEVYGEGKCLSAPGSCPLWLSNYLENNKNVTGAGLQNISWIYGYWISSTSGSGLDNAWIVTYAGNISPDNVNVSTNYGVRPVISIPKLDIVN